MNQTLFDECFDNTKDEYYQILKLIEENKDYPKIQCEGRELHHIIPCNYWMSKLKISRYKAQKIEECKDEDNLISLSYIDHVKMHYFYYKCCKEIINKACIHSFDFMLKTRDIHLKEITESWINEHKQEIEELKEKMSELHSEVAKESNKGRYKYETQEDALKAWENGEMTRKQYCGYCYGRGWKIEKIYHRKYNSENELIKDYEDGKISRSQYTKFCKTYGWKSKELPKISYEEKYGFNTFDGLLNLYKTYKISKNLFIKICKSKNWDYDNCFKQKRKVVYENYESLSKAYQNGIINRRYFLQYCYKNNWKYEPLVNKYENYEDLKTKYLDGDITYEDYKRVCYSHKWENEFKKTKNHVNINSLTLDELKKYFNEGLVTREYFRKICRKNNWEYEHYTKTYSYEFYEDALNDFINNKIKRKTFIYLCNKNGWKCEKFTHKYNTQQEALCGIINGVYMSGPNYMRMCKIHNWSYDVKDYNDAIIEGLKLGNLKKEDIKVWKSIYNEYV